jgi:hypothetical protein
MDAEPRDSEEMPTRAAAQPGASRVVGLLVGGAVVVATFIVDLVRLFSGYNHDYQPYALEPVWEGLTLATPAAGYLAAVVLTVRRGTRRLGQGMLIGLTALLPVAFAATFAIVFNTYGGS